MITDEQSLSEGNRVAGWPDVGQSKRTLKKYGLDHGKVLRAVMRTQDRADTFMPRGLKGRQGSSWASPRTPGRTVADQYESDKCIKRGRANGWKARCVMDLVSRNCMKLSLGGDEWPSRYSSHRPTS